MEDLRTHRADINKKKTFLVFFFCEARASRWSEIEGAKLSGTRSLVGTVVEKGQIRMWRFVSASVFVSRGSSNGRGLISAKSLVAFGRQAGGLASEKGLPWRRPLLVTGAGGAGKTSHGVESCVDFLKVCFSSLCYFLPFFSSKQLL